MAELLFKAEVYAIVGAAMAVFNALGRGFLEAVYQEALEIEFLERSIPFKPRQELRIFYKGRQLQKFYVADFVCFDKIIIEIKSVEHLSAHDEAQLINYLKATGIEVGILINFGAKGELEWRRLVLTKNSTANRTNLREKSVKD